MTATRSAQLVFCDLSVPTDCKGFSIYEDARDKLIARGIALTKNAAFTLLDIRRTPRCVQMMQRDQPFLHAGSRAHLLCAPEQDANLARAHIAE